MEKRLNNPAKFLDIVSNKFPDKTALIQPSKGIVFGKINYKSIKYREFKGNVINYIKILKKRGVKRGDKILLLLPFSFELYIAIVAIISLGAVAVFVEPWMMRRRYSSLIGNTELSYVISSRRLFMILRFMKIIEGKLFYLPVAKVEKRSLEGDDIAFEYVDMSEPAIITFTTGSGNYPKMVVRSYGDLNCQLKQIASTVPRSDTTDLITFPNLILFNLSQGGVTVIPSKKYRGGVLDGKFYRGVIEELDVGRIFMSPKNLETVFEEKFGNRVTSVYTGGGPITKRCVEKIKGIENVKIFYGSTEVEPISVIKLEAYLHDEKCKGIPAGKPLDGVEVKIDCFDNDIGELMVRYDNCIESSYSSRWFKTGDVGYVDKMGNICLMGRVNSISKYADRYIYPFELKRILEIECMYNTVSPLTVNDELVIVVSDEGSRDKIRGIIENHLRKKGIDKFRILFLGKIPSDPRHHSKIEVKKLKKMLFNTQI